jgi:hypothetical protein
MRCRSTSFEESEMKTLIVGDKPTVSRLADRLKRAGSHSEYQRTQCMLIRATLGRSAAQIAELLGWSAATVHVLHSRWSKEGDAIFDVRGRGGRHHQYVDHMNDIKLRVLSALLLRGKRIEPGSILTMSATDAADMLDGPKVELLDPSDRDAMLKARRAEVTTQLAQHGRSTANTGSPWAPWR